MVKRLNIEIPWEQYELLRREAAIRGTSVSRVIRDLVAGLKVAGGEDASRKLHDDPLYVMDGAFAGPGDLAEKHDAHLYGRRR